MRKQAHLRILYLRTFRESRQDLFDTLRMSDYCTSCGTLVMIGSKDEHEHLKAELDGTRIDGTRFDDCVHFIETTEAEWKRHVIPEIVAADAIVMWVRPKEHGFPPVTGAELDVAQYYNTPLSSNRLGVGLLMEASYLSKLRAIEKTIILAHAPIMDQFKTYVKVSAIGSLGGVFKLRDGQPTKLNPANFIESLAASVVSAAPRLTLLDKQLAAFAEIDHWVPYSREPQRDDALMSSEIARALSKITSRSPKSIVPKEALLLGTSDLPRPVFPDYEPKIIKFTPVEDLISLAHGQLVERSMEEVKQASGGELSKLECSHCQSNKIFFYTNGLTSNTVRTKTIRGRCQNCGRRSTLYDDGLLYGAPLRPPSGGRRFF